jgi:hypothetical protein
MGKQAKNLKSRFQKITFGNVVLGEETPISFTLSLTHKGLSFSFVVFFNYLYH